MERSLVFFVRRFARSFIRAYNRSLAGCSVIKIVSNNVLAKWRWQVYLSILSTIPIISVSKFKVMGFCLK